MRTLAVHSKPAAGDVRWAVVRVMLSWIVMQRVTCADGALPLPLPYAAAAVSAAAPVAGPPHLGDAA